MDIHQKILCFAIGLIVMGAIALMGIGAIQNAYQAEINRILNEPLVVESVTRYVERIDDNISEEVFIWTVCNVKCYELKRKQNIAIGVKLELKR